jgi:uncharacterized coiled-coil protein SlyX
LDLLNVVVPGAVSLLVIAGGYFANRKLGISAGQRTLVETLQGTVAAQREEMVRMKSEFADCKGRLEHVEETVRDLKQENFDLRTDLTNALLLTRTPRRKRAKRGE